MNFRKEIQPQLNLYDVGYSYNSVFLDSLSYSKISLESALDENIQYYTSQDTGETKNIHLTISSPLISRDTLSVIFDGTIESTYIDNSETPYHGYYFDK